MTDEKDHFKYANISEEKSTVRYSVRHNNARFLTTHPYSQSSNIPPNDTIDSKMQNFNRMQIGQQPSQHTSQNYHSVGYQNQLPRSQQMVGRVSENHDNLQTNNDDTKSTIILGDVVSDTTIENDAVVSNTEDTKLTDVIKLPENLENLPKADEFPTKRSRWNTNEEILALLLNFGKHEDWQSKDVVIRPESGSMLMYSRKKVRYRRDGYCWKKRKDGKTTREDHMKLKVQGVECIYGCYVHSAVLPTFHRRCYWLLQNPDIVLVHYLNVPYPDDSKLAALIPNIAFWTEKKEWTREELLLQLKPMYENSNCENNGKETDNDELKLNRGNVPTFIESMVSQLLEKQRYVKAAVANSLECGCGNRKCLGASRCSRPIRRITAAKKQGKKSSNINSKLHEKRASHNERNVLKTTAIRKLSGLNVENRIHANQTVSNASYYGNQAQLNSETEQPVQSQVQNNQQQQLQQLLQSQSQSQDSQTQNLRSQIPQSHDLQPKIHQHQLMQTVNSKEQISDYSRVDQYLSNVEFVNADNQHYHSNYPCSLNEQYVPNADIDVDDENDISMNENMTSLLPYNQNDENEFVADKYQSDTTESSDCNSYSTIHHQASPNDSFTSIDDSETYANGDILDDLIMNVNQCHNYENDEYSNADKSLYELIIQLTQKEKKMNMSNSSAAMCEKFQQYTLQNDNNDEFTFENAPISDANGNFLNSCLRYPTDEENGNYSHNDYIRNETNHMENFSTDIDVSFMNPSPEFNPTERVGPNQFKDITQTDVPCLIIDLVPEWSYCEGGTKLLIIGPWYFQSEYTVLFDSYSVPATLIQSGVLKCYCPEHAVGLVSVQVVSGGSIISNSVIFEYKKRPNSEENSSSTVNSKTEHYNQYMYENDTLLKFILIQRIESIQDDAYIHSSSVVNKYEEIREKTTI